MEHVSEVWDRSFSIPPTETEEGDKSNVDFPEKELLQGILQLHGWAGSGFEATPDLDEMRDDFAQGDLIHLPDASLRYFLANSKPMLEPEHMANLRPLRLQAFTCRIMLRLQQDEGRHQGLGSHAQRASRPQQDACYCRARIILDSAETIPRAPP